MASNRVFQMVNERGWRAGFSNLLRKESRDWWGTRRWLRQAIVWTLVLNGTLAAALFSPMKGADVMSLFISRATLGLTTFFAVAGVALGIGAAILGQGEVLDEKRSGTAAWILSKPVSRVAFILGKLVSNGIGILIIMILLQGAIAFVLVSSTDASLSIGGFLAALAVPYLAVMFYFTLAFMLSAIAGGRGAAIGIPMAILFGYQFLLGIAPWLGEIMPGGLTTPLGTSLGSVALSLAQGTAVASTMPIIATLLWCVLFVVIAVWRFNREEF